MSETEARAADDANPGVRSSVDDSRSAPAEPAEPDDGDAVEPSWWHRSHPTFAGLMGFFAGVAYVILVPGIYAALLSALVSEKTAEELFPLVLVALVVPLGLVGAQRTRRFGIYMVIGMVATALVVVGVAALVLWVMFAFEL